MKPRWRSLAVVAASSLLVGSPFVLGPRGWAETLPTVATGANVDESRVTKILYADPAHTEAADDDKHGAAEAPFATFSYACQVAAKAKDANIGVKIVLAAGTYREGAEIRPPSSNGVDSDAPLVIEAAEREQAVIDGADTEGWSPSTWKLEDGRWTHPWPFHRNAVAHPAARPASATTGESYQRGDLILINGTPLRQVNTALDLAPGCFWGMLPASNAHGERRKTSVGENAGSVAVVDPPPDTELAGAIIQVGVRASGLTITGRRNVVVRGLLIQHTAQPNGASEGTAGLVIDRCANVLIEDVLSQWNDGTGLVIAGRGGALASTDVTLRRVRLLHNGGSGLDVFGVNNLLAEDNETSFNNFRGEWAGWIDPQGPAGVKASGVRGSTWRRSQVVGNACRGMWWAEGGPDVTIENSVVRDNFVSGLFVQDLPGPVLVRRCLVTGTKISPGAPDDTAFPAGLSMVGTPDVLLESNVFADNAVTQFAPLDAVSKLPLNAERHVYRHNVFYSGSADASLCRVLAAGGGDPKKQAELTAYYSTLDSEANCFWNPVKAEAFDEYLSRPTGLKGGPTRLGYTATGSKFEDWRTDARKVSNFAATKPEPKVEVDSIWQDPLFVEPSEGDYRLKKASPVADWDLPSDEASAEQ